MFPRLTTAIAGCSPPPGSESTAATAASRSAHIPPRTLTSQSEDSSGFTQRVTDESSNLSASPNRPDTTATTATPNRSRGPPDSEGSGNSSELRLTGPRQRRAPTVGQTPHALGAAPVESSLSPRGAASTSTGPSSQAKATLPSQRRRSPHSPPSAARAAGDNGIAAEATLGMASATPARLPSTQPPAPTDNDESPTSRSTRTISNALPHHGTKSAGPDSRSTSDLGGGGDRYATSGGSEDASEGVRRSLLYRLQDVTNDGEEDELNMLTGGSRRLSGRGPEAAAPLLSPSPRVNRPVLPGHEGGESDRGSPCSALPQLSRPGSSTARTWRASAEGHAMSGAGGLGSSNNTSTSTLCRRLSFPSGSHRYSGAAATPAPASGTLERSPAQPPLPQQRRASFGRSPQQRSERPSQPHEDEEGALEEPVHGSRKSFSSILVTSESYHHQQQQQQQQQQHGGSFRFSTASMPSIRDSASVSVAMTATAAAGTAAAAAVDSSPADMDDVFTSMNYIGTPCSGPSVSTQPRTSQPSQHPTFSVTHALHPSSNASSGYSLTSSSLKKEGPVTSESGKCRPGQAAHTGLGSTSASDGLAGAGGSAGALRRRSSGSRVSFVHSVAHTSEGTPEAARGYNTNPTSTSKNANPGMGAVSDRPSSNQGSAAATAQLNKRPRIDGGNTAPSGNKASHNVARGEEEEENGAETATEEEEGRLVKGSTTPTPLWPHSTRGFVGSSSSLTSPFGFDTTTGGFSALTAFSEVNTPRLGVVEVPPLSQTAGGSHTNSSSQGGGCDGGSTSPQRFHSPYRYRVAATQQSEGENAKASLAASLAQASPARAPLHRGADPRRAHSHDFPLVVKDTVLGEDVVGPPPEDQDDSDRETGDEEGAGPAGRAHSYGGQELRSYLLPSEDGVDAATPDHAHGGPTAGICSGGRRNITPVSFPAIGRDSGGSAAVAGGRSPTMIATFRPQGLPGDRVSMSGTSLRSGSEFPSLAAIGGSPGRPSAAGALATGGQPRSMSFGSLSSARMGAATFSPRQPPSQQHLAAPSPDGKAARPQPSPGNHRNTSVTTPGRQPRPGPSPFSPTTPQQGFGSASSGARLSTASSPFTLLSNNNNNNNTTLVDGSFPRHDVVNAFATSAADGGAAGAVNASFSGVESGMGSNSLSPVGRRTSQQPAAFVGYDRYGSSNNLMSVARHQHTASSISTSSMGAFILKSDVVPPLPAGDRSLGSLGSGAAPIATGAAASAVNHSNSSSARHPHLSNHTRGAGGAVLLTMTDGRKVLVNAPRPPTPAADDGFAAAFTPSFLLYGPHPMQTEAAMFPSAPMAHRRQEEEEGEQQQQQRGQQQDTNESSLVFLTFEEALIRRRVSNMLRHGLVRRVGERHWRRRQAFVEYTARTSLTKGKVYYAKPRRRDPQQQQQQQRHPRGRSTEGAVTTFSGKANAATSVPTVRDDDDEEPCEVLADCLSLDGSVDGSPASSTSSYASSFYLRVDDAVEDKTEDGYKHFYRRDPVTGEKVAKRYARLLRWHHTAADGSESAEKESNRQPAGRGEPLPHNDDSLLFLDDVDGEALADVDHRLRTYLELNDPVPDAAEDAPKTFLTAVGSATETEPSDGPIDSLFTVLPVPPTMAARTGYHLSDYYAPCPTCDPLAILPISSSPPVATAGMLAGPARTSHARGGAVAGPTTTATALATAQAPWQRVNKEDALYCGLEQWSQRRAPVQVTVRPGGCLWHGLSQQQGPAVGAAPHEAEEEDGIHTHAALSPRERFHDFGEDLTTGYPAHPFAYANVFGGGDRTGRPPPPSAHVIRQSSSLRRLPPPQEMSLRSQDADGAEGTKTAAPTSRGMQRGIGASEMNAVGGGWAESWDHRYSVFDYSEEDLDAEDLMGTDEQGGGRPSRRRTLAGDRGASPLNQTGGSSVLTGFEEAAEVGDADEYTSDVYSMCSCSFCETRRAEDEAANEVNPDRRAGKEKQEGETSAHPHCDPDAVLADDSGDAPCVCRCTACDEHRRAQLRRQQPSYEEAEATAPPPLSMPNILCVDLGGGERFYVDPKTAHGSAKLLAHAVLRQEQERQTERAREEQQREARRKREERVGMLRSASGRRRRLHHKNGRMLLLSDEPCSSARSAPPPPQQQPQQPMGPVDSEQETISSGMSREESASTGHDAMAATATPYRQPDGVNETADCPYGHQHRQSPRCRVGHPREAVRDGTGHGYDDFLEAAASYPHAARAEDELDAPSNTVKEAREDPAQSRPADRRTSGPPRFGRRATLPPSASAPVSVRRGPLSSGPSEASASARDGHQDTADMDKDDGSGSKHRRTPIPHVSPRTTTESYPSRHPSSSLRALSPGAAMPPVRMVSAGGAVSPIPMASASPQHSPRAYSYIPSPFTNPVANSGALEEEYGGLGYVPFPDTSHPPSAAHATASPFFFSVRTTPSGFTSARRVHQQQLSTAESYLLVSPPPPPPVMRAGNSPRRPQNHLHARSASYGTVSALHSAAQPPLLLGAVHTRQASEETLLSTGLSEYPASLQPPASTSASLTPANAVSVGSGVSRDPSASLRSAPAPATSTPPAPTAPAVASFLSGVEDATNPSALDVVAVQNSLHHVGTFGDFSSPSLSGTTSGVATLATMPPSTEPQRSPSGPRPRRGPPRRRSGAGGGGRGLVSNRLLERASSSSNNSSSTDGSTASRPHRDSDEQTLAGNAESEGSTSADAELLMRTTATASTEEVTSPVQQTRATAEAQAHATREGAAPPLPAPSGPSPAATKAKQPPVSPIRTRRLSAAVSTRGANNASVSRTNVGRAAASSSSAAASARSSNASGNSSVAGTPTARKDRPQRSLAPAIPFSPGTASSPPTASPSTPSPRKPTQRPNTRPPTAAAGTGTKEPPASSTAATVAASAPALASSFRYVPRQARVLSGAGDAARTRGGAAVSRDQNEANPSPQPTPPSQGEGKVVASARRTSGDGAEESNHSTSGSEHRNEPTPSATSRHGPTMPPQEAHTSLSSCTAISPEPSSQCTTAATVKPAHPQKGSGAPEAAGGMEPKPSPRPRAVSYNTPQPQLRQHSRRPLSESASTLRTTQAKTDGPQPTGTVTSVKKNDHAGGHAQNQAFSSTTSSSTAPQGAPRKAAGTRGPAAAGSAGVFALPVFERAASRSPPPKQ